MVGISQRIKVSRKTATLTQEQLSRKIGVTKSAVSQWESGDVTKITGVHLAAAAAALNVDLNWLITGKVAYSDNRRTTHKEAWQIKEPINTQGLCTQSDGERKLLEKYRALTSSQRTQFQAISDTFDESEEETKRTVKQ